MQLRLYGSAAGIALLLCFSMPEPARAQTDEIQVYDANIAAPGVFNLTWHNNYTLSGRLVAEDAGGVIPNHSLNGVPEWAYGVTDWFEAGLYLPLYSIANKGSALLDGFKLRTLFVEPDAAAHRFIYGINLEFSDSASGQRLRRFRQSRFRAGITTCMELRAILLGRRGRV